MKLFLKLTMQDGTIWTGTLAASEARTAGADGLSIWLRDADHVPQSLDDMAAWNQVTHVPAVAIPWGAVVHIDISTAP